jgi:hypothetical protein
MWVGEPLEMLGVPWPLIESGVLLARGLLLGLVGGLVTGIALRWADNTVSRGRVLRVAILWALVWAASTAPEILRRFGLLADLPPIFWGVKDGIVGLIGGLLTGAVLRDQSSIGVALGWGLGWGVSSLFVNWMFVSGVAEAYFRPPWAGLSLPLGGLGAFIGGGIMYLGMSWARRKAQPNSLPGGSA